MFALLTSFLSSSWLTLLKWGAIIAAIAAVLIGVKNAGRNAEKVVQIQRVEKARKQSEKIRTTVRNATPDERERLREQYYRD